MLMKTVQLDVQQSALQKYYYYYCYFMVTFGQLDKHRLYKVGFQSQKDESVFRLVTIFTNTEF